VDELLSQFQIAGNGGQQIVEVVGDAARELANCLLALGLRQHFLGLIALGEIAHDTNKMAAPQRVAPLGNRQLQWEL
jgi:hypothetical protein